jgi:hypothetical protein
MAGERTSCRLDFRRSLLPLPETAASAVRVGFLAARWDCGDVYMEER